MLDNIFDTLGSYIIRDANADATTRKKEAVEQMAKIKDAEGVNVKKNADGSLAPTIGDSINNLFGGLGGAPTMTDVQKQYDTTQRERQSAKIIDANPTLDYSGIDRSDVEAVRSYTQLQKDLREANDDGIDTTGITTSSGLKKAITQDTIDTSNAKLKGSLQWQTQRGDRTEDLAIEEAVRKRGDLVTDRNFDLQVQQMQNQNNQALATLKATLEQAKMSDAQQTLDREYLDRRDLRDYNYRIKQDDQERMDDIFKLLLGATSLF